MFTIAGPATQIVSLGAGLSLSGSVLADSVCPTLKPKFTWSFKADSETFTFPAGAGSAADLQILSG